MGRLRHLMLVWTAVLCAVLYAEAASKSGDSTACALFNDTLSAKTITRVAVVSTLSADSLQQQLLRFSRQHFLIISDRVRLQGDTLLYILPAKQGPLLKKPDWKSKLGQLPPGNYAIAGPEGDTSLFKVRWPFWKTLRFYIVQCIPSKQKGTFSNARASFVEYGTLRDSGTKVFQLSLGAGVQGRAADYVQQNSAYLSSYTRFYYQSQLQLMGVPFQLNQMMTTEQLSLDPAFGRLNYFQFSFDAARFRSQVMSWGEQKLKQEISNNNRLQDSLGVYQQELGNLQGQLNGYNELLSDKYYQKDLTKYKNIAAAYAKDSASYQRKPQIVSDAQEKLATYEEIKQRKDSLQARYDEYLGQYQKARDKVEKVKAMKENADPNTLYKEGLDKHDPRKYLLDVRKMEIGLVNPDWSKLVFNNTSLRGIQYEHGFGKLSAGVVYGKMDNAYPGFMPLIGGLIKRSQSENKVFGVLLTARLHKSFLIKTGIVQFLHHADTMGASFTERSYPNRNITGFLSLNYFSRIGTFNLDLGRSLSDRLSEDHYTEDVSWVNVYRFGKQPSSLAVLLGYENVFSKAGIKVKGYVSANQQYFFSWGAPNARRDILRYEWRLSKAFFKNKLLLSGFIRQDRDNVSGSANNQYDVKMMGLTANARLWKKLSLSLSYAPSYQLISGTGFSQARNLEMISFMESYLHSNKTWTFQQSGMLAVLNNQSRYFNQFETRPDLVNAFGTVRLRYNPLKLELNGSGTKVFNKMLEGDSADISFYELGLYKDLGKYFQLGAGYLYRQQSGMQQQSAFLQGGMKGWWGTMLTVRIEKLLGTAEGISYSTTPVWGYVHPYTQGFAITFNLYKTVF